MNYLLSFILMFSVVSNAYAYLDPGAGSILIQSLIASIASGLYLAKNYWRVLIKIIFSYKKKEEFKKNFAEEGDETIDRNN